MTDITKFEGKINEHLDDISKEIENISKIKEGKKHYEVLVPTEEFLFGKKVR